MERWEPTPVQGYEVSDLGRVRSWRSNRGEQLPYILKPKVHKSGYVYVTLAGREHKVHRLVLAAFIGPCPDGHEGAHLNGVRTDNRLANLEWRTRVQQHEDRVIHGTEFLGERNPRAKVSAAQVDEIRAMRSSGAKLREIAAIYNISTQQVSAICLRTNWRHS